MSAPAYVYQPGVNGRPRGPRYFLHHGTTPWEWAPAGVRETYAMGRARWERNMLRMYGRVPSPQEQQRAYEALCDATPSGGGITLLRDVNGRWRPL